MTLGSRATRATDLELSDAAGCPVSVLQTDAGGDRTRGRVDLLGCVRL
ncbi:MAG TPA: hypothetical protein VG937_36795 [Polyangiaceae bacterium]|nr:hypothetical protein [Polyangiaceae bacterium]